MNIKSLFLYIILSITVYGYAQNVSGQNHRYSYQMITLDSTYDAKINPKLAKYVDKKRNKIESQMQVVVAHSDEELESYPPESPLSNFLTDFLLENSPKYIKDTTFHNLDLSMLNFGGIRVPMPAGDVTVGDLFRITPFDNYLVFVLLKGRELRKSLEKFNNIFNAPYSGMTIVYQNNVPAQIRVQGKPLDDNRIYKLVTLNFISEGGDHLLENIQYERVEYTDVTFRDFLIAELKAMTARGEKVKGQKDGRAVMN